MRSKVSEAKIFGLIVDFDPQPLYIKHIFVANKLNQSSRYIYFIPRSVYDNKMVLNQNNRIPWPHSFPASVQAERIWN